MSLPRNRHQRQCIECGEVLPPGLGIQFARKNGPPVAKHPRCVGVDEVDDQDWAEFTRLQESEETWHPEPVDDWADEEQV